jgi:hypothetical protein
MAAVKAIQHFRPYLHGRRFQLQTDHVSLKWLMTTTNLTGKLARWALSLQEYDFDVIYKKGTANSNADALSRLPNDLTPIQPDTPNKSLPQSPPSEMFEVEIYNSLLAHNIFIPLLENYLPDNPPLISGPLPLGSESPLAEPNLLCDEELEPSDNSNPLNLSPTPEPQLHWPCTSRQHFCCTSFLSSTLPNNGSLIVCSSPDPCDEYRHVPVGPDNPQITIRYCPQYHTLYLPYPHDNLSSIMMNMVHFTDENIDSPLPDPLCQRCNGSWTHYSPYCSCRPRELRQPVPPRDPANCLPALHVLPSVPLPHNFHYCWKEVGPDTFRLDPCACTTPTVQNLDELPPPPKPHYVW